jgi:hypothetical protein
MASQRYQPADDGSSQRRAGLGALLLMLGALPTGIASASQPEEWKFRVFLDDRAIGHHTFRVTDRGSEQIVETEALFKVKALLIPVYSYRHQNIEVWEGNCLKEIISHTDDNGEKFRVSGSRGQHQFRVATREHRAALPPCVVTFAYWNPDFLSAKRMLNAQTGDYHAVAVTPLGTETITVADTPVRASAYKVTAEKLDITLWYSQNERWLQLESTTEGGRTLRYELEEQNRTKA